MGSKREWHVQADEEGNIDRDELARMMLDIAAVVAMVGGAVVVGARRVEVALTDETGRIVDTRWQTDEIVAQWDSFTPGRKLDREALQEQMVEHLEPGDFPVGFPVEGEPDDQAAYDEEPESMRDEDEATVEAALEEEDLEPATAE